MPPVKAVLFDMDGTLVDSSDAWFALFNRARERFGKAPVAREVFERDVWGCPFEEELRMFFPDVDGEDVLGIWKDPKKMGTPLGSDIRNHKKSLPVLYAINNATKKDRKLILTAYHKEPMSDEDVKAVMDVLERCGAREYAESVAEEYTKKGMAALDAAGLPKDAELRTIARFLIHREF